MLPILFSNEHIKIYAYPMMIGISWGLAYRLLEYSLNRFSYSISTLSLIKFIVGCFFSAWLGAKLLFLAVNYHQYSLIENSSFWLGGGFVFYGGAIGVIIFIAIYSLFFKFFPPHAIPIIVPAAAIGHAVGRVGCFLAGCCFGKECELELLNNHIFKGRVPVQLFETIMLLVLAKLTWILLLKKQVKMIVPVYLGGYAIIRFGLEFFRADQNRGVYFALSTSQWISVAILCSVLIYGLFKSISYQRRQ